MLGPPANAGRRYLYLDRSRRTPEQGRLASHLDAAPPDGEQYNEMDDWHHAAHCRCVFGVVTKNRMGVAILRHLGAGGGVVLTP